MQKIAELNNWRQVSVFLFKVDPCPRENLYKARKRLIFMETLVCQQTFCTYVTLQSFPLVISVFYLFIDNILMLYFLDIRANNSRSATLVDGQQTYLSLIKANSNSIFQVVATHLRSIVLLHHLICDESQLWLSENVKFVLNKTQGLRVKTWGDDALSYKQAKLTGDVIRKKIF